MVSKKLSWLKHKLRYSVNFSFGSIKLQKLTLMLKLDFLEIAKKFHCLSTSELKKNRLKLTLNSLLKQEKEYWKQQSNLT